MKQSQLFTRTVKQTPADETSFNAKALIKAGFIDKLSAGVYSFLPLGLRVHNKICNIVRKEMNIVGGQEILMPALTPKETWQTTGRWENFDALFKLKGNDDKEYALGATHEEIITPLAGKHILSYKDLPTYIYQIQTKFRNELRAKAGLIRGREFSMKDLYSFHTDENSLDEYYEKIQKAYFNIFEKLGLKDITYLTFAKGGAFSKYSHEFQTLTKAGEDTIFICDKCKISINKELIEEQKICPKCGEKDLREEKAIEVGNIFKLGTRFSKPFNLQFTDKDGNKKDIIMGCYGLGPSRLMGTIVEVYHDDKGIIWPDEITPFKVHLISISQDNKSEEIYQDLLKNNIEILYDDRDISPGIKFSDADLIGIPYRIVVSNKTLEKDSVEIKKRNSEEVEIAKINKIIEKFNA
ncbi:aminoacyl--tRNA ligase-related protein [Patescibacteria group bacterium]